MVMSSSGIDRFFLYVVSCFVFLGSMGIGLYLGYEPCLVLRDSLINCVFSVVMVKFFYFLIALGVRQSSSRIQEVKHQKAENDSESS